MHRTPVVILVAFTLLFAIVHPQPATAGIASISGDVEIIAPPFSVQEGAVESNSHARVFLERKLFVLPADVDVDITTPGVFDEAVELTPGTISAGTLVNSYFVHADADGASLFEGSIEFSNDILGIIVTEANLQASHPVLGFPSTIYPVNGSNDASLAALTFDQGLDSLTMIPPSTLSIHLDRTFSNQTYDHVRIITAVPEPQTLTLFGIGVGLFITVAARRRR